MYSNIIGYIAYVISIEFIHAARFEAALLHIPGALVVQFFVQPSVRLG